MSNKTKQQPRPTGGPMKFEGTPLQIGSDVFTRICMPAVREAANHSATTPLQMAQLYSGFLMGAFGSMTADFGQEQALSIARTMLDAFASMDVDAAAKLM